MKYWCLVVPDVPRAVAFYEAAFGFNLRSMHPSEGYAELEAGETRIAFLGEAFVRDMDLQSHVETRRSRPSAPPSGGLPACVTTELERDWERALAAGAVPVKMPEEKPSGQTTGYVRDLNGALVELTTPTRR